MSWLTFVFSPPISIFLSIQLQHLPLCFFFCCFPLFLSFDEISSHFSSSTSMSNFSIFFFIFIFFSARQWKSYAHISSLLYSSQKKTRKEKEGKWSGVFWEILKMVRIAITKISTATGKIFFARSWDVIACEWDFVT